ncbi:MAG: glycosyltransferase family 2 protein [Ketobacteraceae bacterium]|nr:glycosyltransferase family 2 protein [Ketobacteraceae bacterium]
MLVNVAICTCLRPGLLTEALESLRTMKVPDDTRVIVTVVDNDPVGSARKVVERFNDDRLPVRYRQEPRRGIPVARNAAIDDALATGADCLTFIDDDEKVDADWLVELVSMYRSENGRSVISGAVEPLLPEGVQENMRQFFVSPKRKTGQRLKHCATSNVMIPTAVFSGLGLRFDESAPLAGGTDTLFFTEAVARGVAVIHCQEARVYETIPASRMSFRWLARRKFRAGQTMAAVDIRRNKSRVVQLVASVFKLLYLLILFVFYYVTGNRDRFSRELLRFYRTLGKACGLLGLRVKDTYKTIDNSDLS